MCCHGVDGDDENASGLSENGAAALPGSLSGVQGAGEDSKTRSKRLT